MKDILIAIEYFKGRLLDEHGFPIDKEHTETALKALYKANKLIPILYAKHYFKCPFCKEDLVISVDDIFVYDETPPNFCKNCGQALDWSYLTNKKGGADDEQRKADIQSL